MVCRVTMLCPVEEVCLDPGRMAALAAEFGAAGAESLVQRAKGEMALLMSSLVAYSAEAAYAAFARGLRSLRRLAEHVGMTGLAQAAQAVADCVTRGDSTALAATWARLLRLAERGLAGSWGQRAV